MLPPMTRRSSLAKLWRAGVAGAAGVAGTAALPGMGLAATLDLLDRPAPATARGARRLVLDVAAGGPGLVAVGEMGLIVASGDGGATWTQQASPTSVMLTAVAFANRQRGWAAGHDGVVLATGDGGRRWQRQFDGRQANDAVLKAARDALAQALELPRDQPQEQGQPSPRALAEEALASAEDAVRAGPSRPLLALQVLDERRVVAVGAFGQVFATDDGGAQWRYLGSALPNPEGLHLYGAASGGRGEWLLAGEQGVVYIGDASGLSWRRSETGYAGNLHGVLVLPARPAPGTGQDVWLAYGFNGHLFRSTDRGARWTALASPSPTSWVRGVLREDAAWLLAEDGSLFVTRDAGQTFQSAPHGRLPARRYAGFVLDAAGGHLVAVGQGGIHRLSLQRVQVHRQVPLQTQSPRAQPRPPHRSSAGPAAGTAAGTAAGLIPPDTLS